MKTSPFFSIAMVAVVAITSYVVFAFEHTDSSDLQLGVRVVLTSPNAAYTLGQVIPLNVAITNDGSESVELNGTSPESGYVKIWISDSSCHYREYSNGTWGNEKKPPKLLNGRQTMASSAAVLANTKPATSHLNEEAAARLSKNRLMSIYAFPKAGAYYVKAVLHVPRLNSSRIESAPILINIEEPTDENLAVWNKIKERGDIAYFIQEGEVIAETDNQREQFIKEMIDMLSNFPNSSLAHQISPKLELYRANELKRKESLDRINRSQKP